MNNFIEMSISFACNRKFIEICMFVYYTTIGLSIFHSWTNNFPFWTVMHFKLVINKVKFIFKERKLTVQLYRNKHTYFSAFDVASKGHRHFNKIIHIATIIHKRDEMSIMNGRK